MTDRRLFPRSATDEQISIEVLTSLLGVSVEEARRIFEEEGETVLGELSASEVKPLAERP